MDFQRIKQSADAKLDGVTVSIERVNDSNQSVTFTDVTGRILKIAKGQYGELDVLIPAPPKKTKKYAVTGRLLGTLPVNETFAERYEADTRKGEIEKASDYSDKNDLTVTEVEVDIPF